MGGQRSIDYEIYHFCQTPKHDRCKKWRDVQDNPRAAVVIDDIVSFNPWKVRGVEIRGEVETLQTGGETVIPSFDPEMFRITPKRIVSWGLETEFRAAPNARSVN